MLPLSCLVSLSISFATSCSFFPLFSLLLLLQLLALCESDDMQLTKLPCYRSVPSLIPLKVEYRPRHLSFPLPLSLLPLPPSLPFSHTYQQVSGLSALAACHYLADQREKVFQVLYKAINSSVKELQEAGKTSMKKVRTLTHNTLAVDSVIPWSMTS